MSHPHAMAANAKRRASVAAVSARESTACSRPVCDACQHRRTGPLKTCSIVQPATIVRRSVEVQIAGNYMSRGTWQAGCRETGDEGCIAQADCIKRPGNRVPLLPGGSRTAAGKPPAVAAGATAGCLVRQWRLCTHPAGAPGRKPPLSVRPAPFCRENSHRQAQMPALWMACACASRRPRSVRGWCTAAGVRSQLRSTATDFCGQRSLNDNGGPLDSWFTTTPDCSPAQHVNDRHVPNSGRPRRAVFVPAGGAPGGGAAGACPGARPRATPPRQTAPPGPSPGPSRQQPPPGRPTGPARRQTETCARKSLFRRCRVPCKQTSI